MTARLYNVGTGPLDRLLGLIGESLELTPRQRQRAQEAYVAVAQWLARTGSALEVLVVEIYLQGSARLRTETRPVPQFKGDAAEHDVDAVAEYAMSNLSAMELFEATWYELSLNTTFRPIMERKRRCIRLNYPGDFHLDVLPARTDRGRWEPGCIEIPDCDLQDWVPSNPRGYALWFDQQAEAGRSSFARSMPSSPRLPTHAEKPVLNRVVQLWKRRRDMSFKGGARAPRSIILTTIAARNYGGELDVSSAFATILSRTLAEIERASPYRIEVRNPTNLDENFGDAWDDVSYRAFVEFVRQCEAELAALTTTTGLERLVELLKQLFGVEPVNNALEAYRAELRTAADEKKLRVSTHGGLVSGLGSSGILIPRSTHYGRRGQPGPPESKGDRQ